MVEPVSLGAMAGVQLGSSLLQGLFANHRARKYRRHIKATESHIAGLSQDLFNRRSARLKPYSDFGLDAVKRFRNDFNAGRFNTSVNLYQDPGYNFRLREGQRALSRQAAARGRAGSGAFSRALSRYSQDYASQEYNAAFARNQSEADRRYQRGFQNTQFGYGVQRQLGQYDADHTNQLIQGQRNIANAELAVGASNVQSVANLFDEANDVASAYYQQPNYALQGQYNNLLGRLLSQYGNGFPNQQAPAAPASLGMNKPYLRSQRSSLSQRLRRPMSPIGSPFQP